MRRLIDRPEPPASRHVSWGAGDLRSRVVIEDGRPVGREGTIWVHCAARPSDDGMVGHWYPVPPELLAAFRAGEDWRPCVDWLIEAYSEQLGWLATAVAEGVGA